MIKCLVESEKSRWSEYLKKKLFSKLDENMAILLEMLST